MKICPTCHSESPDSAKFCQECGTPLSDQNAQTDSNHTDIDTVELISEPAEIAVSPDKAADSADPAVNSANVENKEISKQPASDPSSSNGSEAVNDSSLEERWYYVESGKSKGPFSRDAFLDLIVNGTIKPDTYVWSKGMDEWTHLDNTALYTTGNDAPEPIIEEEIPIYEEEVETVTDPVSTGPKAAFNGPETESQEWYYMINNRTVGPFSEAVMIRNIQQGLLVSNTYVWREGYPDWKHLSETPLAAYLPADQMGNTTTFTAPEPEPVYRNTSFTAVQPRSILLYLLLSILTCGIFQFVWMYLAASDLNKLCQQKGRPVLTDPILVVIFSFLTCGIFSVYYFWKAGNTVYELSDRRLSDNSLVLAILALFLQPAALAILQDQINSLVQSGDYN